MQVLPQIASELTKRPRGRVSRVLKGNHVSTQAMLRNVLILF